MNDFANDKHTACRLYHRLNICAHRWAAGRWYLGGDGKICLSRPRSIVGGEAAVERIQEALLGLTHGCK